MVETLAIWPRVYLRNNVDSVVFSVIFDLKGIVQMYGDLKVWQFCVIQRLSFTAEQYRCSPGGGGNQVLFVIVIFSPFDHCQTSPTFLPPSKIQLLSASSKILSISSLVSAEARWPPRLLQSLSAPSQFWSNLREYLGSVKKKSSLNYEKWILFKHVYVEKMKEAWLCSILFIFYLVLFLFIYYWNDK